MRSLLPNPDGINVVQVTEDLPVSAFGCNLHIKKNSGLLVLYVIYFRAYFSSISIFNIHIKIQILGGSMRNFYLKKMLQD